MILKKNILEYENDSEKEDILEYENDSEKKIFQSVCFLSPLQRSPALLSKSLPAIFWLSNLSNLKKS